jgi:hypothetical protein
MQNYTVYIHNLYFSFSLPQTQKGRITTMLHAPTNNLLSLHLFPLLFSIVTIRVIDAPHCQHFLNPIQVLQWKKEQQADWLGRM